jgi:outer membrane protein assembly factor BamB
MRAEAALLLGSLGSPEYLPFLAALYLRDADPAVKASAAEAMGRIGLDTDALSFNAFMRQLAPGLKYRNEQALTATASATRAICRFTGPGVSEAAAHVLTALYNPEMPALVRSRAKAELDVIALYDQLETLH